MSSKDEQTSADLAALTGAYVLDSLDDIERARFERHLTSGTEAAADAAEEVVTLRAAAAELSHIVAAAPPPQLRAGVLGAIARVRPEAAAPANGVPRHSARASGRWAWQLVAAACAVTLVVATTWGYRQSRTLGQERSAVSGLYSVMSSTGAASASGHLGTNGSIVVVYSRADRRFAFVGHHIPHLDASKTYQLWAMTKDGVATSAGTFRPNANGDVLLVTSAALSSTAAIGVSVERAGGASTPTATSVLTTIAL